MIWRASVGSMLLLLLLLLLKYYPEEKKLNVSHFCNKNEKMFQIVLNSGLREDPDLKIWCWFRLFEPVMSGC